MERELRVDLSLGVRDKLGWTDIWVESKYRQDKSSYCSLFPLGKSFLDHLWTNEIIVQENFENSSLDNNFYCIIAKRVSCGSQVFEISIQIFCV